MPGSARIRKPPVFVGIGGGSGSGKSLLAAAVQRTLPCGVAVLELDWYYHDQAHLSLAERAQTNYDHPDALDFDLLLMHLDRLRNAEPIDAPEYLYGTHVRGPGTHPVSPAPVVLAEGLLALSEPRLRERFGLKVFVDTPDAVRRERRLERDMAERGRTRVDVLRQYRDQVRPMHMAWVEPGRRHADIVVSGEENPAHTAARVCDAIVGLLPAG